MRKLEIGTYDRRKGCQADDSLGSRVNKVLLPNPDDISSETYVQVSSVTSGVWARKKELYWLRDALNTLLPDRYPNEGYVSEDA